MSLKSQIEQLKPGESLITEMTRGGAYIAAQRAGVVIGTEIVESVDGQPTKIKVTRVSEPLTLTQQVAALSPKDRLELFERFELCCGMNRGECVCSDALDGMVVTTCAPDVHFDPVLTMADLDRQAKLDELRELMANPKADLGVTDSRSDEWIEDPQTYENGEILYRHHKPKCKPVCYRRESDPSAC